VTVSIGDRPVLPLSDAAIVAVPAETPVTANVALDAPAATSTGVCTIATAGLLVDSAMLEPPAGAAAVRLTVACPVPPAGTVAVLSVTLDTVGVPVDGAEGESEPQLIVLTVTRIIAASAAYGVAQPLVRMDETSIHARGARDDPRKPCSSARRPRRLCGCPGQDSTRCTDTLLNAQEDDSREMHFHAGELYDFDLL